MRSRTCPRCVECHQLSPLRLSLRGPRGRCRRHTDVLINGHTLPLLRRSTQRHGSDLFDGGRITVVQLVTFISMDNLPSTERDVSSRAVLIRWMGVSLLSRNHQRDSSNRPVCEYPLSANHCLYQWSDIGEDRCCFRGIERTADRLRLWDHLPQTQRARAIESERRAYYDIIDYGSILDHTNITVDPSTGHMLQTIQMI